MELKPVDLGTVGLVDQIPPVTGNENPTPYIRLVGNMAVSYSPCPAYHKSPMNSHAWEYRCWWSISQPGVREAFPGALTRGRGGTADDAAAMGETCACAGRLSSRFRRDFNNQMLSHFLIPDPLRNPPTDNPQIRGKKHQTMAGSIRVSLPDNDSNAGADEDSCGSPGGSPARPRPQKRRRIPVACGACRSKKSRVS